MKIYLECGRHSFIWPVLSIIILFLYWAILFAFIIFISKFLPFRVLIQKAFIYNIWDMYGFPGNSVGKESTCNAEDPGSIPGPGRSPGEGIGYPFQYPGLENSMDCIVHRVAKSQTQLSNFHTHFRQKSLLLRQSWKGLAEGRNLIKIVPERC